MQNTLLVIDGLNLIRRVYEANPAPDGSEKAEAAINTAHQSFHRALREHRPSHCIWAFDAGGLNWRHSLYPDYKKDRKPMPAELQSEVAKYKETLRAAGWAQAEHPGFEADDTMGSIAFVAGQDADVILLTTDKDAAATCQYGAEVYNHFTRVWQNATWCLEKFGVRPDRIQDLLAIMGDKSDGIPGIYKVGVKTAAKLLNTYGDLEGVLAAAPTIEGKLGERLQESADIARLSRKLTALRLDLYPEGLDWPQLVVPETGRY